MFTVKWTVRHKQGEVTRMFSANEVIAAYREFPPPGDPNMPKAFVAPPPPASWRVAEREVDHALVILDPYESGSTSLAHGIVYVMNEQGATVSKFVLCDAIADYGEFGVPANKPDILKAA